MIVRITRIGLLSLGAAALVVSLALASPAARVRYVEGVPQIELEGSYPQSRYAVYRSTAPQGAFERITNLDVLCLGTCYAQDASAEPGRTYWYRFELILADGSLATFGPFAITISAELASRLGLRLFPNPVREAARVEIRNGVPGGPGVAADVALLDLQGRRVKTFVRGSLPGGTTSVRWDGTDDAGRRLAPGGYFLRVVTPLGTRVARVLRVD